MWRNIISAATGENLTPDSSGLEWLLALEYPAILGLSGAVALVADVNQLGAKLSETENWKECPVICSSPAPVPKNLQYIDANEVRVYLP